MKYFLLPILAFLLVTPTIGQRTIEDTLEKFNKKSVPYISVDALQLEEDIIILDTREKEEFNVSHLKNAIWVGYKNFEIDAFPIQDKNQKIVVYCSIGVRSETIGEKLAAEGYTHVQNLYGGIFRWVAQDYPVYDNANQQTNKVHIFSKYWGKLLTKGKKVLH